MKIIVNAIPKYPDDCIFCGNRYYDVCSISECQCELAKRKDCPYLTTVDTYLWEAIDNRLLPEVNDGKQ